MTIFSYAAKLSLQIIFLVIRALLPPYCHLPNCFLLLSIRIIHTMGMDEIVIFKFRSECRLVHIIIQRYHLAWSGFRVIIELTD